MNTKEFIEELVKNQDLQKKFEGINTPEKFYEIAKENGLTDDFETMKAAAMQVAQEQGALNEEDLEKLSEVAGGSDVAEGIAITTGLSAATIGINLALIPLGF